VGYREEFDTLLSNTVIESNMSKEQIKELYIPLIDFAIDNLPDHLYRYRTCSELNIGAFESDSVWAVLPTMFNDAHDSLFYHNTDSILSELRNDLWGDNLVVAWEYINQHNKLPEHFDTFAPDVKESILSQMTSISKEELIEKASHLQFCESDKLEASIEMKRAKEYFRNQAKIACFCGNKYSNLMWAHYADYHKGFLLEYDKQTILKFLQNNSGAKLFPVIYNGKRYNASHHIKWCLSKQICSNMGFDITIPIPDILYFEKTYLHKATEWKEEEEWRLIHHIDSKENGNVYEFKYLVPSAIYYGTRISPINKKILSLFVDKKRIEGHDIKEYDICINEDSERYELISK